VQQVPAGGGLNRQPFTETTMVKLSDLPQELRDAIYIEDCHVTGTHDPTHTDKYVCGLQLRDMAVRILHAVGIKVMDNDPSDPSWNEIPRKLDRKGWFAYYQRRANGQQYDKAWAKAHPKEFADVVAKAKTEVERYERWEREGILIPANTDAVPD
jgi:hypothetical protein